MDEFSQELNRLLVSTYRDVGKLEEGMLHSVSGMEVSITELHLLEAKTGAERTSLQLEGNVEGSPAVYHDVLVIGTTGTNSNIYGIKLE